MSGRMASGLEGVDPGIRRVVAWLIAHDFTTTDSGDGKTKIAAGFSVADDCVLDFPHVHMTCARESLIVEADRLAGLVIAAGVKLTEDVRIEACYLPIERIGVLSLFGVSDAELPT